MRDDQITARLRVLHPNIARLFELARTAQRKPSRHEALLNREILETFGPDGLVLRRSAFASSARQDIHQVVPDAVRDMGQSLFGEQGITVMTAGSASDSDELILNLVYSATDSTQHANTVHRLTLFLGGLAKLDRYALQSYWATRNPAQADRDRKQANARLAALFGMLGGLHQQARW